MSARRFNEADVVGEFADALAAAGFRLHTAPVMDGAWHRAAVQGDKGGEKSGRYKGYLDGIRPAGFIEDFRDPTNTRPWKAGAAPSVMSAAERAAVQREMAEAEARRTRGRAADQADVAARAAAEWASAAPAPPDHPYLVRKRVLSHGTKISTTGDLLVPMRDFEEHLGGLHTIDAQGRKLFAKGGRVIGLHLLLGSLAPGATLLIVEGFATGATLHQATGHAVAVAFSKTNYVGIAHAYEQRFPGLRIAFCGDNDHHHPRRPKPLPNVGRVAAEEAARDTGSVAILPPFASFQTGSDWNDFEELHGPDAVRAAIEAGFPPPPPPPLQPYYPAPVCSREEAIAALPHASGAFFGDAERNLAIRRDWQGRQAEIEATHPPKSRERRAALREARRTMVDLYGKNWRAPGRRLLLPAAAGTGKTKLAAQEIAQRRSTLGNVFFATDKLENAVAVAVQIPGAVVIRGRSAADPKSLDGKKMCWRPKAAEAVARAGLPVGRTLCRNGEGKVCLFISSCGYQREAARMRSGDVTVFCGSHEYLTKHGPMPKPNVVVIDENCIGILIGHVEFGLDRLLPDAMPNWQAAGLELATDYRRIMVMVGDAIRSRGDILAALRQEGITQPDHLAPAIQYIRAVEAQEFTAGIAPDMDDAEVVDLLERHQRSEIGNVLKMLTALQGEIALPRDQAHGVVFQPDRPVKVDGQMERQARITVHYRKRLAFAADLPVLVLDASGDVEVYRRLFGDRLEVAAAVRCERNAEVVQIRDMPMPRTTLLGADRKGNPLSPTRVARGARLRAEVVAVADALAARHGSLMLATNRPVEAELLPALGEVVATGHFGALRGKNDFEACAAGLILGREQTWPQVAEGAARAIWATDPEPLHLPGAYAKATRGIRMRDGSAVPVPVDIHPDPRPNFDSPVGRFLASL